MLEALGILAIICIPGAIPVYCFMTFMWGFMDSYAGFLKHPTEATKRYQVYSLYKVGAKFYTWMTERVK